MYKIKNNLSSSDFRLRLVAIIFIILTVVIIVRLVILMLFQHGFYEAMAAGTHDTYAHLVPKRGQVFVQDTRSGEEYPLAINRDYFIIFADTRMIKDDKTATEVTNKLTEIFGYDETKKTGLNVMLNKRVDAYEVIEKKVEEDIALKIQSLNLTGIGLIRVPFRYYPEGNLAATVIGFVGKDEKGTDVGRYGIEGYWQKELAGVGGYFSGAKSAVGGLIPLAGWSTKPAEDGSDLLLTIDRTLEYQACEKLAQAKNEYGAESATLIMMEPETGAIRVMCSLTDFNPNNYTAVSSTRAYNNTGIFTPYEPGSVFKAITMAAALNEGAVTPESTFVDTGSRADYCSKPIKNAMDKSYGLQNMSGILENSINTGMVYIIERLGKNKFADYIKNFGFGIKEGIELDTEVTGTVDSLKQNKGDKIDCYTATASFGQGITVTPLQIITAYSAIANGGKLMKPYIVQEIRYADGRVEKIKPKLIREVISKRAAMFTSAMLINVVDKHSKVAQVKGYYVGGKTGTAQISGLGGYSQETNQTFIGFAPADNPKFVMLVKFEKPRREWAESTASPVFGELASFILNYYQVPPTR